MRSAFKKLTIALMMMGVFAPSVNAIVFEMDKQPTHLRFSFEAARDQLYIEKIGNVIGIKTLNKDLFENLKTEMTKSQIPSKYIKGVTVAPVDPKTAVSTLNIELKDDSVEIFNFYRDRESKYVIDFWVDTDSTTETSASIEKAPPAPQKLPPVTKAPAKKPVVKASPKVVEKKVEVRQSDYRDYRYGAPFVWDYAPLIPEVKKAIELGSKTPEFFYPIQNRKYETGDKEAHLQLAVNLYRKDKFGLMYKSLKLFAQKYGAETESTFIEYLKANAILKDNLLKGNEEPIKMGISMLATIAKKSNNYEMRRGIHKYLLTYYLSKNDFVNGLEAAKYFYVDTKENYDYEESPYALEMILYNLSELGQFDKIAELVEDKTVVKIVSGQTLIAYKMFTALKLGDTKKVIQIYEIAKPGLAKPVHAAILYNGAEAYFREAKYDQAIALYDDFLVTHSYMGQAGEARLRIALAYDLQAKDESKVLELYKNAIDRSQNRETSFEARIRYVAFRTIRKYNPDASDLETRVFLENDNRTGNTFSKDLQKLLWIVRLRTFIVDKKYQEAMAYLKSIPLTSFKVEEKRVFEGDGSEIVYGMIQSFFAKGDYANVIKAWEVYKDQYVTKVALDPMMNFLVGKSYLKLGLFKGFDRLFTSFKERGAAPTRTYPIWVSRTNEDDQKELFNELDLARHLQLKNFDVAEKIVNALPEMPRKYYYLGLIQNNRQKYDEATKNFERFLTSETKLDLLDEREVADMLEAYAEGLYNLNDTEKFIKVATALLEDTNRLGSSDKYVQSIREKIAYLRLESMASKRDDKTNLILEANLQKFMSEFPESNYRGRIQYLYGTTMLLNDKVDQAKEVFTKIIDDKDITPAIKEMARSELSLLKIKARTL